MYSHHSATIDLRRRLQTPSGATQTVKSWWIDTWHDAKQPGTFHQTSAGFGSSTTCCQTAKQTGLHDFPHSEHRPLVCSDSGLQRFGSNLTHECIPCNRRSLTDFIQMIYLCVCGMAVKKEAKTFKECKSVFMKFTTNGANQIHSWATFVQIRYFFRQRLVTDLYVKKLMFQRYVEKKSDFLVPTSCTTICKSVNKL